MVAFQSMHYHLSQPVSRFGGKIIVHPGQMADKTPLHLPPDLVQGIADEENAACVELIFVEGPGQFTEQPASSAFQGGYIAPKVGAHRAEWRRRRSSHDRWAGVTHPQ